MSRGSSCAVAGCGDCGPVSRRPLSRDVLRAFHSGHERPGGLRGISLDPEAEPTELSLRLSSQDRTDLIRGEMPKNSRPDRVRHLPDIVLDELEKLSEGDWRRVTVGPDGDVVVHNWPQVCRVELEPQGTTAKKLSERGRRHAPRRAVANTVPTLSQQWAAPADFALPSARPDPPSRFRLRRLDSGHPTAQSAPRPSSPRAQSRVRIPTCSTSRSCGRAGNAMRTVNPGSRWLRRGRTGGGVRGAR